MPTANENAMPSLIPRASMSNMQDRLKLKSSRERLSSTSPRSSPASKGARSPTKNPLSPVKGSLPRTFVKSLAALAVENQNVRRAEVDNTPAFTQIFEKWSPTVPKAPRLRTEQRALKRSQSPDKMVEFSCQTSGRPRMHATNFDDRFLSQRHPRPQWLPLLQEYIDYVEHRRDDPARRVQPMPQVLYVVYLREQARLWDAFQAAVQEYITTRPAEVRNTHRGEWQLFNIEEPADAEPDNPQQAAWRRFMLQRLNLDDFVPQTVRRHRDARERALRRAIYEFVEDGSQTTPEASARAPAPARPPKPPRSAHSSDNYPWQPPRLLTPSVSSATKSSADHLYMRADAHRDPRPAGAVRLHAESVPNLRRPQPQDDRGLRSSRTSPEKDAAPKNKRDERPRQTQLPTRRRQDSEDGEHYAAKQKPQPRRKDDDDDDESGFGQGKHGPTWGKDSTSNDKMETYRASHPRYNGTTKYGPHGRYYPGHSRGTNEHANVSGLDGSAAPFIPQNGRFEQILPREQLVRSVNWHKEEGKIPCGFSERAKFNQGGYRAGIIAV